MPSGDGDRDKSLSVMRSDALPRQHLRPECDFCQDKLGFSLRELSHGLNGFAEKQSAVKPFNPWLSLRREEISAKE